MARNGLMLAAAPMAVATILTLGQARAATGPVSGAQNNISYATTSSATYFANAISLDMSNLAYVTTVQTCCYTFSEYSMFQDDFGFTIHGQSDQTQGYQQGYAMTLPGIAGTTPKDAAVAVSTNNSFDVGMSRGGRNTKMTNLSFLLNATAGNSGTTGVNNLTVQADDGSTFTLDMNKVSYQYVNGMYSTYVNLSSTVGIAGLFLTGNIGTTANPFVGSISDVQFAITNADGTPVTHTAAGGGTPADVPEPALPMALLGLGALGALCVRRAIGSGGYGTSAIA